MRGGLLFVFVFALVVLSTPAGADWDIDQSYKWLQLPDLDDTGMDVAASAVDAGGRVLGDDFQCTETGPITDIHIWGSWLNDLLPFGEDPNAATFTLSIWSDNPAGSGGEYSTPAQELWSMVFSPGQFSSRIWAEGLSEGWFGPPDNYLPLGDTICWQYNFFIDPGEAFIQEGTPDVPIIYWLVVQARPDDLDTRFGWKTSLDHWNDDAVWGDGIVPFPGPWYELRYPWGHPMEGQSIDLAFVITDSIHPIHDRDYGDAPAPYRTLQVDVGASHLVHPMVYINVEADPEPDGQPDPDALGDDNDGFDDEACDLLMGNLAQGEPTYMLLYASVDGFLDGWVDFFQDGSWVHPVDQVFASEPLVVGWNLVSFITPVPALPGDTFMRLRFSLIGGLDPMGAAPEGEVEDFGVEILPSERFKWVQLPDPDVTGMDVNCSEDYLAADDFRCKYPGRLTEFDIWGSWFQDILPDGDPENVAFRLAIHEDIPVWQSSTGYSMPGNVLWARAFPPGSFTAREFMPYIEEGWLEPPENYIFPGDWTMWLYTFTVPPPMAYHQIGTPDSPDTLWLSVQAVPQAEASFGWKTSRRHWNDDAVWNFGTVPHPGPWDELIYPPGHVWEGDSIDLAFGIRMTFGTGVTDDEIGDSSLLRQNVPNPFNPKTVIEYVLPSSGHVTLEIYDAAGHLVRHLVDGTQESGEQVATWDGRDDEGRVLASGVYFYRLKTEATEATRKMVILK